MKKLVKESVKSFISLNEREWNMKLNASPAFLTYEDNEDPLEFKNLILDILNTDETFEKIDLEFGEDAGYEFSTVMDEFEMADDEGSIDYALELLYDWADEYGVWIEKHGMNENLNEAKNQCPECGGPLKTIPKKEYGGGLGRKRCQGCGQTFWPEDLK